ncbi:hypothetical protein [Brachybacterium sp. UNK5269]|uniref:hypothetical protein n=1 Tax=Brachybacterium sp. UNK5269 TaxID=3408576 RepID=UPI003BB0EDDB
MSTPVRDQSRPEGEEDLAPDPKDLEVKKLSPSGLVISGAAAATASVVGGQLGVAGTVIGAALTSVVSAVALALYSDSVHRGSAKLKQATLRGAQVKDRPGPAGRGEAFRSRTAASGSGAAADGTGGTPAGPPPATGPGRRRVLKTVLLALGIALIGLLAVFGIQRVTGTELSPGTGQIQRTVGDSDAVAPREDSGSQPDAPEDTEQQDPVEDGVPVPEESESPQPGDQAPADEDEVEVDTPAPAEQAPAPGTEDGGTSGEGSGGGSSGAGDSARADNGSSEGSGAGTE